MGRFVCCMVFAMCLSYSQAQLSLNPITFIENFLNRTISEIFKIEENLAMDVEVENVRFLFYPINGARTNLTATSPINYSNINTSTPIKFIIHGWGSEGNATFIQNISRAYHSIGINNVIGVDWSIDAKQDYIHSAACTKSVGQMTANFIQNLLKNQTHLLKNVHIIGHSLGAQIAGFAGQYIQTVTNGSKVGRITALDAANPLFTFPLKKPNNMRVTAGDAVFVDAIHTNVGFFGIMESYATADFYVNNGGPIQPGCENLNVFEAFSCSHSRSHAVFLESITNQNLKATRCDDSFLVFLCIRKTSISFGEHVPLNATGVYYSNVDVAKIETTTAVDERVKRGKYKNLQRHSKKNKSQKLA